MDDEARALQWLVRALGRHAEGEALLSALDDGAAVAPLPLHDLVRRAAAMGLVAYRDAATGGETTVWLTLQGEQALGSLQAQDE